MCSFGHAGSSPVSRTTKPLDFQGVSAFLGFLIPPPYPHWNFLRFSGRYPGGRFAALAGIFFCCLFIFFEPLKKVLHPGGALPVHRFRHMGLPIQGKRCGIVVGILLHGFHVIPCPKSIYHIRVPLGYNNDKTGNPYGTRLLSESDCKLQFLFHANEGGSEPVREG